MINTFGKSASAASSAEDEADVSKRNVISDRYTIANFIGLASQNGLLKMNDSQIRRSGFPAWTPERNRRG